MPPSDDQIFQQSFHREIEAVKDLLHAKMDGVQGTMAQMGVVLDRVASAVEKQAEQSTRLAVLEANHGNLRDAFVQYKESSDRVYGGLSKRLRTVEGGAAQVTWKVKTAQVSAIAILSFLGACFAENFTAILHWVHGGA